MKTLPLDCSRREGELLLFQTSNHSHLFNNLRLRKGDHMKTPFEKATKVFNIIEASTEGTSLTTVVVLDEDRLEREVLKGSIADSDVQKLLPFHTKRVAGEHYIHIMNESAYVVETNSHAIYEGDTLCKRGGQSFYAGFKGLTPTCPGCLAKGKAIIVNHLLNQY